MKLHPHSRMNREHCLRYGVSFSEKKQLRELQEEELKSVNGGITIPEGTYRVSSGTYSQAVPEAAEEKFRKIQEAYETIKKEHGMN